MTALNFGCEVNVPRMEGCNEARTHGPKNPTQQLGRSYLGERGYAFHQFRTDISGRDDSGQWNCGQTKKE